MLGVLLTIDKAGSVINDARSVIVYKRFMIISDVPRGIISVLFQLIGLVSMTV